MSSTSYQEGWTQAEADNAAGTTIPFSATHARETDIPAERDWWDGYAASTWQLIYRSAGLDDKAIW